MPTDEREQNHRRKEIAQGKREYLEATEHRLKADINTALEPLHTAIDRLGLGREALSLLVQKWAGMVHLAKSYGTSDYTAARAFDTLIYAELIAKHKPGSTLVHEEDEGGQQWFDVIRIVQKNIRPGIRTGVHKSLRGGDWVPDVSTPLPILKTEVLALLKELVPTTTVDRPSHDRRYYTEETALLWRATARAEYLHTLRQAISLGVDIPQVASLLFSDEQVVEGIKELVEFIQAHSELSPLELAEMWSGERYHNSPNSNMTHALTEQDALQTEIRSSQN